MTIEIEEKDIEESMTVQNDLLRSSNSDARNITPTGLSKNPPFPRNDTTEALIHSTRSIKLVSTSPRKRTPTNLHQTLTSINRPKEKFTKLDEHNELEFVYSKYFDLKDE